MAIEFRNVHGQRNESSCRLRRARGALQSLQQFDDGRAACFVEVLALTVRGNQREQDFALRRDHAEESRFESVADQQGRKVLDIDRVQQSCRFFDVHPDKAQRRIGGGDVLEYLAEGAASGAPLGAETRNEQAAVGIRRRIWRLGRCHGGWHGKPPQV